MKNQPNLKLDTSADVLQSLLQNSKSPLSDQFQRWKLWLKWNDVVGESIAKNTQPVDYRRGTLFIWVKSSTWLHHMSFISGPLKDKVNEYMGREWVERISFTLDRKSVPTTSESDPGLLDYLSR